MERAVGWFVLLATALLLFGFGYYLYNTAQRKGWFKIRAPYYTFVDRATGLRVGDPVMLMEGDELVLLHQGRRSTAQVVPEKYHTLKAIAHIPLAIYVMLLPVREGSLGDELVDSLAQYQESIDANRVSTRFPRALIVVH